MSIPFTHSVGDRSFSGRTNIGAGIDSVAGAPLAPGTTAIPRRSDHDVSLPPSWYCSTMLPVSLSIATIRSLARS